MKFREEFGENQRVDHGRLPGYGLSDTGREHARRAAEHLAYRFCDTGVLYRGLAWLALRHDVDPKDADALVELVARMELGPALRAAGYGELSA